MAEANYKTHPLLTKEVIQHMVKDRRHFHQHPELSFEEVETAKYIVAILEECGVEDIKTGVGKTGVTGLIKGEAGPGPCIGLRADMDALPIQETTGLDFQSQNDNVMHACGHDAHMSILLGVVRILCQNKVTMRGCIKLLFQPAEEGKGGAPAMIADGCLENPKIDKVYGLHMWSYGPVGQVVVKEGAIMASSDHWTITVKGSGGHGAIPQGTVDAVVAACSTVTTLHTIISRNIDPFNSAVLTVGFINGGYNFNVIADEVKIGGTVRTMDPADQKLIMKRMKEIVDNVCAAHGATAELDYRIGYPATVNEDLNCIELVKQSAEAVVGVDGVDDKTRTMAAEDFSYFLKNAPGVFYFVGCDPRKDPENEPAIPHHKSVFTVDERALEIGASVTLHIVDRELGTTKSAA
eukprot:Clim_evm7s144 gene=Clim_evmTU7s144